MGCCLNKELVHGLDSAKYPLIYVHNIMNLSLFYCSLLALQFGLQPILSSTFQAASVSRVVIVMVTEFLKIIISVFMILRDKPVVRKQIFETWTFRNSLEKAFIPAVMFSIQNLLCQFALTRLDSLTFNVVNQTKVC